MVYVVHGGVGAVVVDAMGAAKLSREKWPSLLTYGAPPTCRLHFLPNRSYPILLLGFKIRWGNPGPRAGIS